MKIEKVYFETEDGIELFGLLHKPDIKTKRIVISVHGMSSNCFTKRDDILANEFTKNGIAYFSFNNRGTGVVTKFNKKEENKIVSYYGGAENEDVLDSYYDIKVAIYKIKEMGYEQIYLQGHSLGCLKSIYTYNKLKKENDNILKNICAVLLLSIVDIYDFAKNIISDFDNYYNIAIEKEKLGDTEYVMSKDSFITPLSVKTYLRYFKYNEEINYPRYSDEKYDYSEINNIDIPIFIRFGDNNECIVQDVDKLVGLLKQKIINSKKDISYIKGANHSYHGKEKILAKQEIQFINSIE